VKKILQSRLLRRVGKFTGSLLVIYMLVYSVLSVFGSYQPAAYDLRGVMWYEWAPAGFYDAKHAWPMSAYAVKHPDEKTGGWSQFMFLTFMPLYYLDNHFIHKGPSSHDATQPSAGANAGKLRVTSDRWLEKESGLQSPASWSSFWLLAVISLYEWPS
jgi:hypothetical protein